VVKEKTRSVNLLKGLLDGLFPEFTQVFKDLCGQTALRVLSVCPIPELIDGMTEDEFIKFHAKQGLMLFIIEVAVGVIGIIPLFGGLVVTLGILICGLLSLAGIVQVLMGNKWNMPVIAEWAEKFKI
jgi:uncharacterized membrane protein